MTPKDPRNIHKTQGFQNTGKGWGGGIGEGIRNFTGGGGGAFLLGEGNLRSNFDD